MTSHWGESEGHRWRDGHTYGSVLHMHAQISHTHTHLTNLQGPLRLSKNSHFLVFADIRTVGDVV